MFSMNRVALLVLPVLIVLLAAACGEDATPTPVPPTATPTPIPPSADANAPTTFVVERFEPGDGFFELRMGAEPYWGYDAGVRVNGPDFPSDIVMTVNVGDTIHFGRVSTYWDSTVPHNFTVEGLGVDLVLNDAAGERANVEDYEITFTKPGEFIIDDSLDPGTHGNAKFVVLGDA